MEGCPVETADVNVGRGDAEIENFHYSNPELQQDPSPLFERMRAECPVSHSDRYEGFWVLSKYDDVWKAYEEPNLFSSWPNAIPAGDIGSVRPVIPVEIDPPDHGKYRQILASLFTVHRLRPMESKIRAHVVALIDAIAAKDECDYVAEFARELPTRVFLEMMGWPYEDAPMFLDWCDVLMRGVPGDEEASRLAREETGAQVYAYFAEELDKREGVEPIQGDGADFIDWLRAASFGGERELTQFEILDCIFIVLLAGLDTTQGVLSFATEYLATHPEQRRELVENPEILDSAVEEFLRFYAPVAPGRRLTEDLELRGVQMKAGDRVMLLTGSACRDEEHFPDSESVDLRRQPNRHIAFGAGAHRCLGSHLARMELRIAFEEWHKRFPDYHVTPGSETKRHFSAVRGVDALHLTF